MRKSVTVTTTRGEGTVVKKIAKGALGAVASLAVLLPSSTAFAGIAVSIPPNYPPTVIVGQNGVAVSLVITNSSADDPGNPGVDSTRTVTITNVFHTPSCGAPSGTGQCGAGSEDPGVFQPSAT